MGKYQPAGAGARSLAELISIGMGRGWGWVWVFGQNTKKFLAHPAGAEAGSFG